MRIASRDAVARTEADRSEAWVMPGFFIDQTSTLILLSRGFGGRAPEATKKAILHQHKFTTMEQAKFTEINLSMINGEDEGTIRKWFFETARWVEIFTRKQEWGTVLVLLNQMRIIVSELRRRQILSNPNNRTDPKYDERGTLEDFRKTMSL